MAFTDTYSDRQREAIIRAALEQGMSAAAARRNAMAGGLYGLPPFEPAIKTVQLWIREAKLAAGGIDPEAAVLTKAREIQGRMFLKRVKNAERKLASGELSLKDQRELLALTRDYESWTKSQRLNGTAPEPEKTPEPTAPDLVSRLAASEGPSREKQEALEETEESAQRNEAKQDDGGSARIPSQSLELRSAAARARHAV